MNPSILEIMFGDIREGRVSRASYVAYSLLASVLAGFALMAIVLALGSVTALFSSDVSSVGVFLTEKFGGGPGLVILFALSLLLVFVHANLTAKRYRDMGLPGWKTLFAVSLGTGLLIGALPALGGGLQVLLFLILLLMPSNAFGNRAP